ncbi:MAG: hypothetical protein LM558_02570 [Thermosphaera sp.]|nr:hypothetical protein [Thermosphaera sp.]
MSLRTPIRGATPADVWGYPVRTLTSLGVDVLAPTEDVILWEFLGGRIFRVHDESPLTVLFPTVYSDKATVVVAGDVSNNAGVFNVARIQPNGWGYKQLIVSAATTADHYLYETRDGLDYQIGYEAVDVGNAYRVIMLSVSGSTLKAFRVDLTTPRFTVTSTQYASGRFGFLVPIVNDARIIQAMLMALSTNHLRAPASPGPRAVAIIEVEFDVGGIKLFKDVDESRGIDRASVTVGAFEASPPTSIVTVFSGNPYTGDRAIDVQKEYARSKGLKVLRPPKDYREAVEQYMSLRAECNWLAGKDSYAYQALGLEELDLFQNVDFYYGELLEHRTHYQQLKQVPDAKTRGRLEELADRLSKVTVLAEERDKHIAKAKKILRVGW